MSERSEKRKRSGGLGKNAFFRGADDQQGEAAETSVDPTTGSTTVKEPAAEKPKKVRTTVMLYPETMAGMEALKTQLRKNTGKRVTYSDILNKAILDFMDKEGIKLEA